jgi:serine/threonine-protein kinase
MAGDLTMNTQTNAVPSLEQQLDDLLLRWQELRRNDPALSASQVAADSPELVEELRRRIRALQSMEVMLGLGAVPANDPEVTQTHPAVDSEAQSGATISIPGYRIEALVSRGGMGVVYRARQLQPDRVIALKMILSGCHAGPDQRERFRREAEAVARLNHPNVVQIYEVGEHAGQPFFSMEYVSGGNLAQRLTEAPVTARQAAELTAVLADAIAYAHSQGVVHRDLKPANILLQRTTGDTGDTGKRPKAEFNTVSSPASPVVQLLPKITDFGLAKRLDVEAGHTPSVAFLGTPSYMAPEQAEGRTRDVGPLADIYALGTILYEMLTGRPPFRGETEVDTLSQVRSQEPVPPSRWQPKVPRDLETICLKCLRKEPDRRYASAADLAADLRRFLDGQPIQARPTSWWEIAVKWVRRNPAWTAVGAITATAIVALLLLWASFTADLQKQRDDARHQQKVAEEQRQEAQEQRQRAQDLLKRSLETIIKNVKDLKRGADAKQIEGTPGALYFVMAAIYAETADAYRRDDKLTPTDRDEFVARYYGCSMELLKNAAEFNYFNERGNRDRVRTDPRFDQLRRQPVFGEWSQHIPGLKGEK